MENPSGSPRLFEGDTLPSRSSAIGFDVRLGVWGFGSLKLVNIAWGESWVCVAGSPPDQISITLFFGGLPLFRLNMASMLVRWVNVTSEDNA